MTLKEQKYLADGTAIFEVDASDLTLKEFVNQSIKQNPLSWGKMKIIQDFKIPIDALTETPFRTYSYERGVLKAPIDADLRDKRICKLIMHGGFTMMDYYIKLEELH